MKIKKGKVIGAPSKKQQIMFAEYLERLVAQIRKNNS